MENRKGYTPVGYQETKQQQEVEMMTSAGVSTLPSLPVTTLGTNDILEMPPKWRGAISRKKAVALGCGFVAMLVISLSLFSDSDTQSFGEENSVQKKTTKQQFDNRNRAVLSDYDTSRVFADFMPGVGGFFGTPMWVFFVNRGQGVTTYGTENKDTPMMEFNSANKAYEYANIEGFRTFVKGRRQYTSVWRGNSDSQATWSSEPFGEDGKGSSSLSRKMMVGMNEVEIEEIDNEHELQTNVLYYTIPGEEFAALVRRTTFTNLAPEGSPDLELEVLDGQPKLIPAGSNDWNLKNMGRTMEAWMNVYNMESSDNTEPLFKLSMDMADTAEVSMVTEAHWAISFLESKPDTDMEAFIAEDTSGDATVSRGTSNRLYSKIPFIVDPSVIFGQEMSFAKPFNFFDYGTGTGKSDFSLDELLEVPQVTTSKTPCAFAAATMRIPAGSNITLSTVYGRASSESFYQESIRNVVNKEGYLQTKYDDARGLIQNLTNKVEMQSGVPVFDAYVRQQYMDNFLRGGFPAVLGNAEEDPKIFHTFSRIHGDLERDYNYFQIDASYFSVGPGNFRDVNQNRRTDTMQEPKVGEFNANMFLSFVQADGYNPLTVNSAFFYLPDALNLNSSYSPTAMAIATQVTANPKDTLNVAKILSEGLAYNPGFRPGDLFIQLDVRGVQLTVSDEEFLSLVTSAAKLSPSAAYAQDAFWADHWTYHLDLVETFLTIFPEKEEEYLFGNLGQTPFFMSPVSCYPRSQKYVMAPKLGPRQYNFVYDDKEKTDAMARAGKVDPVGASWQRSAFDGSIVTVSAYVKLLMLAMSKFTLLDPAGMGIEYEGGKPGWNDAMNGLCGLFGSGMPETFEALRILQFLLKAGAKTTSTIDVPEEMDTLIKATQLQLNELNAAGDDDQDAAFNYWDKVRMSVESYRESTRVTFSGNTVKWTLNELAPFLEAFIAKMEAGISKAISLNGGTTPTYWIFDVDSFELLDGVDDAGRTYVKPLKFTPKSVPLFLEGPTRQMKTVAAKDDALAIYKMVKDSALHDKELGMYTISESLTGMSFEIGRMMAFAPGWLENESVWLHMSYKFYLELLRATLYEEFFEELYTGLVAFMDVETYGRSPLECSSFIASSAHPDKSIHGQGYLARLSGSTAEFLSMWNLMMMGHDPFKVDDSGNLSLGLEPIIPAYFFDEQNRLSFTFLGHTKVTYINPTGLDTWADDLSIASTTVIGSGACEFLDEDESVTIEGGILSSVFASGAREGCLQSITIFFQ